jgi:hypothetical protein
MAAWWLGARGTAPRPRRLAPTSRPRVVSRRARSGGRERVDAPPHFAEAQAEQELWEELRDHDTSLNRALNEALRIHGGLAWRVFQVRGHLSVFRDSSPPLCCFCARTSLEWRSPAFVR